MTTRSLAVFSSRAARAACAAPVASMESFCAASNAVSAFCSSTLQPCEHVSHPLMQRWAATARSLALHAA